MFARVLTAIQYSSPAGSPTGPINFDFPATSSIAGRSLVDPSRFSIMFPRIVSCDSSLRIGATEPHSSSEEGAIETFLSSVRMGDLKAVEQLVRGGFDVRSRDEESWNCLHWATEMGHQKLVLFLLDCDPLLLNMKTKEGLSPINIAAWRGDKQMVELLLAQGAEIDDRTKWGEVPLHHAVTFGHAEVCEILLKAGADPFSEDKLKRTPYAVAMQRGNAKVKRVFAQYTPKE